MVSRGKKLRVAVLMGGRSPEYDVSLATGQGVVSNLDTRKYEVIPVVVSKDGQIWEEKDCEKFIKEDLSIGKDAPKKVSIKSRSKGFSIPLSVSSTPDVFFIAMHGPFGEDGTIQGMLDFLGVPYTGSGVLASALGMNKVMFRRVMDYLGIPGPKWTSNIKKNTIPLPIVVKPVAQGSSVGVSFVREEANIKKAIREAEKYGQVMIEELIEGIEVSCGVLGNNDPFALPVIEICPSNEFFDYEAKYTAGKCEEIVPARIPGAVAKKAQALAVDVYKGIGCRGFGRVDMIVKDGKPYVLEINTIPGLTPASLLPKEAAAAGISYPELLDKVIGYALEK